MGSELTSHQVMESGRCFNRQIETFIARYSKNNRAIDVNFRKMIPELNKADRATHLVHTYPAKLLMHIPHFFLNNSFLSSPGDTVLDPFCGSGTVLLESLLSNRNSLGADSNPLARLIASVKIRKYHISGLLEYYMGLEKSIKKSCYEKIPEIIDVDYWFLPSIQKQLAAIYNEVNKIPEPLYRDFFLVCFSNLIKKVSLADPRVSVPVRLRSDQYSNGHPLQEKSKQLIKNLKYVDVKGKFLEIASMNIERVDSFNELRKQHSAKGYIVSNDARILEKGLIARKQEVDLIITSPPYAGAQKYIRASSLNLGWLKLTNGKSLKELEQRSIGREEYLRNEYVQIARTDVPAADNLIKKIEKINPLRAHIASNYLKEMREAFKESVKVLKPGGYFVLVAANNQVCGKEFRTQEYLMEILQQEGLNVIFRLVDDIKSYGLMTKRNKTASVITREWVLLLQK